jgi:hypothetical protein
MTIREKLKARAAKPGFFPPADNVIFTIQSKVIGSLQSFVCFQGLPKQGKSLFITSCIASAFTPFPIFDMKLNLPAGRGRVCYIDTESSEYDFYRVLDRIRQQTMFSSLPDLLDCFLMREDAPGDIMAMTNEYLDLNPDCSVLVIDGVLDLLADFNSVEQSFFVIQWLKLITKKYNLLIMLVLHLSKKEQNSIGHIGSFLDRKSQSVLKVGKNKETGTIDLESTFLRSADSINPVSVMFSGTGWVEVAPHRNEPHNKNAEFISVQFANWLPYIAAVKATAAHINKSDSSAKRLLKDWVGSGLLVYDKLQGYKVKI